MTQCGDEINHSISIRPQKQGYIANVLNQENAQHHHASSKLII